MFSSFTGDELLDGVILGVCAGLEGAMGCTITLLLVKVPVLTIFSFRVPPVDLERSLRLCETTFMRHLVGFVSAVPYRRAVQNY